MNFTNPLATFRCVHAAIVGVNVGLSTIDEMQVDCGPTNRGCTPSKPEQAPSSYG